jgi:hypothetical protein
LQARTQETKAEARAKYEAEMAKLRQQSDLAVAKLEELKAAGEDSWEKMVAEMEKIRDAIHPFIQLLQVAGQVGLRRVGWTPRPGWIEILANVR